MLTTQAQIGVNRLNRIQEKGLSLVYFEKFSLKKASIQFCKFNIYPNLVVLVEIEYLFDFSNLTVNLVSYLLTLLPQNAAQDAVNE